jgi:lipid-binding SYLF domain-containing protein
VAILPDVVKAGFVVGGRYGRGVILLRQPDGSWSNPVFITLAGGGIGWQVGVQSTDLVLVFKTSNSLDRILKGKGKLTLGADVAVAAGPVGRQAEAATDAMLRAEIYSYSRSRGLFAGVSVEGAGLLVDCEANEAFYGLRGGRPDDILHLVLNPPIAAVECLKAELSRLSMPAAPPVIIMPPQTPPPPQVRPVPPG